MPTIEPVPGPARDQLHQQRDMAEPFGADADRYHRARPSYPEAMVERIVANSPGRDFSRCRYRYGHRRSPVPSGRLPNLGVDVDARMAELARQDGFQVEVASFETWGPGGRDFDVVIAGQAWH